MLYSTPEAAARGATAKESKAPKRRPPMSLNTLDSRRVELLKTYTDDKPGGTAARPRSTPSRGRTA